MVEILKGTFVLYEIPSFSKNISNELKKSKKYYLYDSGIRNAILKDFSDWETRKDKGILSETFILHELVKEKNRMRIFSSGAQKTGQRWILSFTATGRQYQ